MLMTVLEQKQQEFLQKGKAEGIEIGTVKGIEIGKEQGIEKGIEIGIKDTALKMLKENIALELIAKVTGLSIDEINNIVKN